MRNPFNVSFFISVKFPLILSGALLIAESAKLLAVSLAVSASDDIPVLIPLSNGLSVYGLISLSYVIYTNKKYKKAASSFEVILEQF